MTLPPGMGIPEHDIQGPSAELPPLEPEVLRGELGTTQEGPQDAPRPRKRGRPPRKGLNAGSDGPGAPEATEPNAEELAALAQALGMSFEYGVRFVASRRGNHWLIAPEEKDLLGQAWATALAPYMGAISKYTPMFAAVVVTAGVLGPRVTEDARLAEEANKTSSPRGRKKDDAD